MPSAPPQSPEQRNQILLLAREGRAWEVVTRCVAYLRQEPQDAGVRFLLARALVNLHLPTLAERMLQSLPDAARAAPQVRELEAQAAGASEISVPPAQRLDRIKRAMQALGEQSTPFDNHLDRWSEREQRMEQYEARDGNVVRCRQGEQDPARWLGLLDARGASSQLASVGMQGSGEQGTSPVIVDGIRPPWVLAHLLDATPRLASGFQTRVRVIERSADAALDGLAMAELAPSLRGRKVEFYLGERATDRLKASILAHPGIAGIGQVLQNTGSPPTTSLAQTLSETIAMTRVAENRLRSQVEARYASRDKDYWRARYRVATAPGSDEPLRVLVTSCLYTTYVQHAASDLLEAFRGNGCKVELVIEADHTSSLTTSGYLEPIERLDPDLIISINYTRHSMPVALPRNIPFVCWIQDQLPHLYRDGAGTHQGELDFVIGYARRLLFDRFGYPPERAMFTPVVASAKKFSPSAGTPEQQTRLACDVAYVSNQSQTPRELHEQIKEEAGDSQTQAVLDEVYPIIERAVGEMHRQPLLPRMITALRDATTRVQSVTASEPEIDRYVMQYGYRIGELVARNQMLHWASEACGRRGWTLKLFGRGWEKHPTLARHAQGPLVHGDDLRVSYGAARVHLHASVSNLVHQRVIECALSGGLPLCRSLSDIRPTPHGALHRLGLSAADAGTKTDTGRSTGAKLAFAPIDHPGLLASVSQWQKLGWADALLDPDGMLYADRAELDRLGSRDTLDDEDWACHQAMFSDLSLFTFSDASELEAMLDSVIGSDTLRASMNRMLCARANERFTSEALAARISELVASGLGR